MNRKRFGILTFLVLLAVSGLMAQIAGLGNAQSMAQSATSVNYIGYDIEGYSAVEIDPEDYIVGSGDKFLIQVNHLNTTTFGVDVLPMGDLIIPGIGQIHLSGLVYKDAVEKIIEKCKERFSSAEVNVSLSRVRDIKIPVFGAVQNPEMITMYTESDVNNVNQPTVRTPETAGTVQKRMTGGEIPNKDYVLPASLRLSDLMTVLPLHYLAKENEIEVRGILDTHTVNIYKYYMYGDLEQNPFLYKIKSIYIPYADIQHECVHVFGPINTKNIVPILPGETLYEFIERKIQVTDISNYDVITLKRDGKIIVDRSYGSQELDIELVPGDVIEISSAKRIMVNGFVNAPGIFNYVQGHTVADYIAMAGGVNARGSNKSAMIIRGDKKIRNAESQLVERGDIIIVKRSLDHIFVGDYSVLEFLATLASVTLSFIAAYNTTQ